MRMIEEKMQAIQPVEVEYIFVQKLQVPFCDGCLDCINVGESACPEYATIGPVAQKMDEADGLILGSPIHTFNITGLMKNFVEYFMYKRNRPSFFGKKAVVTATASGGGHTVVLDFLEQTANAWGCDVVARAGISSTQTGKPPYVEKMNAVAEDVAATFIKEINKGELGSPKFRHLMNFRAMQNMTRNQKNSVNHRYWTERDWLATPSTTRRCRSTRSPVSWPATSPARCAAASRKATRSPTADTGRRTARAHPYGPRRRNTSQSGQSPESSLSQQAAVTETETIVPFRFWWGLLACAFAMGLIFAFAPYSTATWPELAPDKGNWWYAWQLQNPTVITRLSAWIPYTLHIVSIWYLIHAAKKAKPKYIYGLHTFNLWALGVNAFFVVLHIAQTKLFYDGLAQDVHEATSMGSVTLMLFLILLMENRRRRPVFRPQGDVHEQRRGYAQALPRLLLCMGDHLHLLVPPGRDDVGAPGRFRLHVFAAVAKQSVLHTIPREPGVDDDTGNDVRYPRCTGGGFCADARSGQLLVAVPVRRLCDLFDHAASRFGAGHAGEITGGITDRCGNGRVLSLPS